MVEEMNEVMISIDGEALRPGTHVKIDEEQDGKSGLTAVP